MTVKRVSFRDITSGQFIVHLRQMKEIKMKLHLTAGLRVY